MPTTLKRLRKDQAHVTVKIDGRELGTFDTFSGGETTGSNTKYRPGGMGQEEALGGPPSVGDITLTRSYRRDRDSDLYKWLNARVGAAACVVKKHPLDADKNPFGSADVYTGLLTGATPPEHDSTSADAAMLAIVITPDETVA